MWRLVVLAAAACGRIAFEPRDDAGITDDAAGPTPFQLSSHGQHSCIVREDNSLWCWGRNERGQLGIGGGPDRDPVQVPGAWDRVWTGEFSTCARSAADRTLWCWGRNDVGLLGRGAGADANVPQSTPLPPGVEKVAISEAHACAVVNGEVWCWGRDDCRQASLPGSTVREPAPIPGLPPIVDVMVHDVLSCARDATGTLYCWGHWYGGPQVPYTRCDAAVASLPQTVQLPSPVVTMQGSCHAHACVSTADGGVHCVGYNSGGQLGVGDQTSSTTPRQTSIVGARLVSTGSFWSCAVTGDGVHCWGENINGRFADGTETSTLVPTRTAFFDGRTVDAFDLGCYHGCARVDGDVYCWGTNTFRAIGDGTTESRLSPVRVLLP